MHRHFTSSRWALKCIPPEKKARCALIIHAKRKFSPHLISCRDARTTGLPGSFRSNSLVTQKWKEKVTKKTALLKPGRIETRDGSSLKWNMCITLISTNMYIHLSRHQDWLFTSFSWLHCKKRWNYGETAECFMILSHLISLLDNSCLHPILFISFLAAIKPAMHARRLRSFGWLNKYMLVEQIKFWCASFIDAVPLDGEVKSFKLPLDSDGNYCRYLVGTEITTAFWAFWNRLSCNLTTQEDDFQLTSGNWHMFQCVKSLFFEVTRWWHLSYVLLQFHIKCKHFHTIELLFFF